MGGAAVHGPEKVSLSTMPTYKATAVANAAAAQSRPAGGNAVTGPVTAGNHNPALGRPAGGAAAGVPGNPAGRAPAKTGSGSPKSNGREHEKKPQALSTPAVAPAIASQVEPSRKVERPAVSNAVSSNITVAKPQPQPQPQVRTVMKVESGSAGAPPPRVVSPPSRPQPAANNNSGGRNENRGDDSHRRDREKDKK